MFLRKFWVSLALTVPVVVYSFGRGPAFGGSDYLPAILGSVVFFYGGWIFIKGAWLELKGRTPGMMTLIGLAIGVAYTYSLYVTLTGEGHDLFWELTTLITVMLLGHWLEMKSVQSAQGALKELSKLLPDTAEIVTSDTGQATKTVSLSELKIGDIVLVRPGGKIPTDGKVVEGESEVNESLLTGESQPVLKKAASVVVAGAINSEGALKIEVTHIGEHTFLAGVMRLVAEAQASKSKLQLLSDKAAYYLTVIAVIIGGGTFTLWLIAQAGFSFALERLVAVLVIACPHALGLAIPLVASISTTLAARHGFLVRDRLSLELARKIDVVLFDKTGTLTQGSYGLADIWPVQAPDQNSVLQLAASVDLLSEHFISKAIVKSAREKNISLIKVDDFVRLSGRGVKGNVDGAEVLVGGRALLRQDYAGQAILDQIVIPDEIANQIETEGKKGKTIIYVIKDGEIWGVLALTDLIRDESRQAVAELKKNGIKVGMITGDSQNVADWVAKELGIDEYFAQVLPNQKSEKVKQLQVKGYKVGMVGDGINDAPALTQADLGIAIGAGTNVAIESAGIILVRNDPRDIIKIIALSKATYRKMIQNLFWATGYNVVALPLAAGVLASKGLLLQPAVAAVFMSLSTIIVAFNAVLLKKIKL
ncbi:MAG: heavy metal translocating P-type ATPase [Minisyncoccia bacterium]